MAYTIIALYKFLRLENPLEVKDTITKLCQKFQILGGLIFAEEGINGTLSSPSENVTMFLSEIRANGILIEDHEIKFSTSDTSPFYRLVRKHFIRTICLYRY